MSSLVYVVLLIFTSYIFQVTCRVLELSDAFLKVKNDGMWFVKFYAPWCGHCKRLEPVFKNVAQSLIHLPNLRVGQVDGSRFSNVATEFEIAGFPTIAFIKNNVVHFYNDDRTFSKMLRFAERMYGPHVIEIQTIKQSQVFNKSVDVRFLYIGERTGETWTAFDQVASKLQQFDSFFQIPFHLIKDGRDLLDNSIYVFKDSFHIQFRPNISVTDDKPKRGGEIDHEDNLLVEEVWRFVRRERFSTFEEVSRGSFDRMLGSKKYVAFAVIEHNKIGEIDDDNMKKFLHSFKSVVDEVKLKYHETFLFGWTSDSILANSIAIQTLIMPCIIVVHTETYKHNLFNDLSHDQSILKNDMRLFLERVDSGEELCYGGKTYIIRCFRALYELCSNMVDLWKGNPVLSSLLFGLPIGFLSLIFYSICCAGILDANDDDEELHTDDNQSEEDIREHEITGSEDARHNFHTQIGKHEKLD